MQDPPRRDVHMHLCLVPLVPIPPFSTPRCILQSPRDLGRGSFKRPLSVNRESTCHSCNSAVARGGGRTVNICGMIYHLPSSPIYSSIFSIYSALQHDVFNLALQLKQSCFNLTLYSYSLLIVTSILRSILTCYTLVAGAWWHGAQNIIDVALVSVY